MPDYAMDPYKGTHWKFEAENRGGNVKLQQWEFSDFVIGHPEEEPMPMFFYRGLTPMF